MSSTEMTLWSGDDGGLLAAAVDPGLHELAVLEENLQTQARRYMRRGKADATWKSYEKDLMHFGAWCDRYGRSSFPATPETVQLYLVDHAPSLAISTLRRRVSAISQVHEFAGVANPTRTGLVVETMKGIVHTHGRPANKKTAAVTDVVTQLVQDLGPSLVDVRNRALILIDFAGAMRRSELVALDVGDITETADGLKVQVKRSKTDQEGRGSVVGIAYGSNRLTCPVRSWRAWLDASGITDGPAFRRMFRYGSVSDRRLSADYVLRAVKDRAEVAQLNRQLFGAHSLRSGFATTAFRAGVAKRRIMDQGRWTTTKSMHGYIQEEELFVDNPSAKLGL